MGSKKMDENKTKKLKTIGYKIQDCCEMCCHGDFTEHNTWGTCKLHKYKHLKHSGGAKTDLRALSIHKLGNCEWYTYSNFYDYKLHGFMEFK